jgi:hypothetical protein
MKVANLLSTISHGSIGANGLLDVGRLSILICHSDSREQTIPALRGSDQPQISNRIVGGVSVFTGDSEPSPVAPGNNINAQHLSEAINYRALDRSYWQ